MSNKTLPETPLVFFVPTSISGDEQIRDMCEAIQAQLDQVTAAIPAIEIYRRIDELPEDALRLLAWENRVYGAEWSLAKTIEDKRALVKGSFELNNRRGTRWAVERIFELLRLRAEIAEWWEDSAPLTVGGQELTINGQVVTQNTAPPGTFRIVVLDVSGRGIEDHEIALLDELIELYKPLTRHNQIINLGVESAGSPYVHSALSMVMLKETYSKLGLTINNQPVTVGGQAIMI